LSSFPSSSYRSRAGRGGGRPDREQRDYLNTSPASSSGHRSGLFGITTDRQAAVSSSSWYRHNQQHDEIVEPNQIAPQKHPVAIQIKSHYESILETVITLEGRV
jgi:hypothetical protein